MVIDVADAGPGLLTKAALIVIRRKPQAININRAAADRGAARQLFAKHDQVVLVSQQGLIAGRLEPK
jgi:hypothetical protein